MFANYISDHYIVATVRNIKIPKTELCFVIKLDMKHWSKGFFMICFSMIESKLISLLMWKLPGISFMMVSLELLIFSPQKVQGKKGRNNAWFSTDLSSLLHEHNVAWSKSGGPDHLEPYILKLELILLLNLEHIFIIFPCSQTKFRLYRSVLLFSLC